MSEDETRDLPRTTEELRSRMASGRTMGRSPAEEPGVAPIGTDDEAAGRPADAEAVERASTEQYVSHEGAAERYREVAPNHRRIGIMAVLAAAFIVIATVAVLVVAV